MNTVADDIDKDAGKKDIGNGECGGPFFRMGESNYDTSKDLEIEAQANTESENIGVCGNSNTDLRHGPSQRGTGE